MVKMTAALHDGIGIMRTNDIERPEPGPYDALIRVRSTGICGSDLLNYSDNSVEEKFPAGHEVAGEIVDVGKTVDPARIGERVAIDTIGQGLACTTCWYCRQGQFRQCQHKAPDEGGGFAQFLKRRAYGCYPLSPNMSWEEGALVEPLAVSIHGLRRSQMHSNDTVVVLGAGTIGLTAVAAARALGAGYILVTARHKQQRDMAKLLGANGAFSPDDSNLQEALGQVTEGRGSDLTIETVGGHSEAILNQAIDLTRMQGRICILGGFRRDITLDWLEPLLKEQAIFFSSCYSVLEGYHDYEIAIDLLSSGRTPLKQIVTHKFPLEEIQQGFTVASDKTTGSLKVQLHQ